jgi:hypothetical protein
MKFDKRIIPAAIFDRDRRPQKHRREGGIDTIWESRDGRFRVVCSEILYGRAVPGGHYPPLWRAYRFPNPPGFVGSNGWVQLLGGPWRGPGPAFAAVRRTVQAEQQTQRPPARRPNKRMAGAQGK